MLAVVMENHVQGEALSFFTLGGISILCRGLISYFALQVKTIFVDGLPASWDEDYVQQLLKDYGEIEKIELARNMPSAKRKDFGFITFDTHENALTCANCINNAEIGEGDNKVC